MNEEQKKGMEIAVLSLIEKFDDLEEETCTNFTGAKRVILRWSRKHNLFTLK